MPTLKHPTLPDVTVDVSDEQVSDWTEQGWIAEPVEQAEKSATTTKGK